MVHRSPEALLEELGIAEPSEIDIEAIAYHCGAVVRYRHLDGCAARIIGRGDQAVISVETHTKRERQRFSIGHELGHWVRDRGKAVYLCQAADLRSPWNNQQNPESRANDYAANLLMPAFMFRSAAKGRPMTFETVGDLAEDFQTSQTATAIRLVQLGSYPAMVACYGMEGRRWYSAGPDIPYYLRPHRELSHDTDAFDLLFGKIGSTRSRLSDAASWIDHRSSDHYTVHEQSIRISDDAVLALIWWKDEAQLVDLMDY
ncbi:MAG: ImmA/IrrE family metallo-endopeptidase [Pseudomonadota bacterium]|nr:ImmA/IrrE family metallo-endopeptidase [Pseudomonadota bacterium]